MKIVDTEIHGVKLLSPEVFADKRGAFVTFIDPDIFQKFGLVSSFSQFSASVSQKGVIRGLHFQWPQLQVKLARVVRGEIFDVTVDLRPSSETFRKVHVEVLRAGIHTAIYVPPGVAHGFQALIDDSEIVYAIEPVFALGQQYAVRWDDGALRIRWPLDHPMISENDRLGMSFDAAVEMMFA